MKIHRYLSLFLIAVLAFAPLTMASHSSHERPLSIKDAEIFTRYQARTVGEVTVCNDGTERTRFTVRVTNEDMKAVYTRNLVISGAGCHEFGLKFDDDFSELTNEGDRVRFSLRDVRNGAAYKRSKTFSTFVESLNDKNQTHKGGDDTYVANIGDFIYHVPTGVRIKVKTTNKKRVELIVGGIQWGGSEIVRIWEESDKEVIAGDDNHTRLTITNVQSNRDSVHFEIESD